MNGPARNTALVIEADDAFRESTAFLLRRIGYARVETTDDPLSGLARILGGVPPDVVVCAAGMQPITGMEILARVRANEATRSLPFIISTFDASGEFWSECLRAGATDHVLKPFTMATLADALDMKKSAARLRARLLSRLDDAM